MRVNLKTAVIIFSVLYIVLTLVTMYRLYSDVIVRSDESIHFEEAHDAKRNTSLSESPRGTNMKNPMTSQYTVEIWAKAAIGLYLWKHVLSGELQSVQNGFIQEGYLTADDITLVYRSGPGIIQTTVPSDVQYLVLVLNGRSEEKIMSSKMWLDYLPLYQNLKKLAVVLLGNERCDNNWILPYVRSRGGRIDLVFLVYDSPLIDNVEFYQWPLGVAVYRGFPNIKSEKVDVTSVRSHMCNFLGTVYENSSREILSHVIKSLDFQENCIILERKSWRFGSAPSTGGEEVGKSECPKIFSVLSAVLHEKNKKDLLFSWRWLPLETEDSLKYYMDSLLKSDLTLSLTLIHSNKYNRN
ncbi:transmembrane protein 5-like [Zootermopsis nevadensis]|uniref:transmembrane protein 5-like n=1 Tax=Zootermopsis nevadensis TaxID=136037 RepID=UPI000B8ECBC4|nr:transmembrane protein 5-like [Zootermopsis nevadensis]